MFVYPMRGDSRKRFPHPINRNHLPGAVITAVRRIGPHWIIAGRRARPVAVFFIKTTVLSARAAS